MKSKIPEGTIRELNGYIETNSFDQLVEYMKSKSSEMSKYNETVMLFQLMARFAGLSDESKEGMRYYDCQNVDDIVEPAFLMKDLLHRVEFADPAEKANVLQFMAIAHINVQELMWMIDMFCLDKQLVLERLK